MAFSSTVQEQSLGWPSQAQFKSSEKVRNQQGIDGMGMRMG
jgi:hypothetical protein